MVSSVPVRVAVYTRPFGGRGDGFIKVQLPERPYENIHLVRWNCADVLRRFWCRVVQAVAVGLNTVLATAEELDAIREIDRQRLFSLMRRKSLPGQSNSKK